MFLLIIAVVAVDAWLNILHMTLKNRRGTYTNTQRIHRLSKLQQAYIYSIHLTLTWPATEQPRMSWTTYVLTMLSRCSLVMAWVRFCQTIRRRKELIKNQLEIKINLVHTIPILRLVEEMPSFSQVK